MLTEKPAILLVNERDSHAVRHAPAGVWVLDALYINDDTARSSKGIGNGRSHFENLIPLCTAMFYHCKAAPVLLDGCFEHSDSIFKGSKETGRTANSCQHMASAPWHVRVRPGECK